jgi:arylsulfatase A-like enzyme
MAEERKVGITRRDLLKTAAIGAATAGLGCAGLSRVSAHNGKCPNIVFLLTDDQRWDSLGCMGNPIVQTPNLDALAAGGTLFTNHFATTPICAASRASIFTGLHTRCHGIEDFGTPLSPELARITYPFVLRNAGYRTAFIGKYGLGGDLPVNDYDYFDGFEGQGFYFQKEGTGSFEQGQEGGPHLTAKLGGKAVDFLQSTPTDMPFCLSVSFKAPHVQDQDPRQYLYDPSLDAMYRDDEIPPPPKNQPYFYNRFPAFIRDSEGRRRWHMRFATPEAYQRSVKGYYRLVSGVDREVGRIMTALAERGLANNTIVVFTSDQGIFNGERGLAGKWLLHEESIRAPLIIYDPRVPEPMRGQRCDAMSLNIDLSPTLMALAGESIPNAVQGRDLSGWVHGSKPAWREECFFEHHFGAVREPVIPASDGIRTERWKYIRYVEPHPRYAELYNLAEDPREYRNHADELRYAETQAALATRWHVWTEALARWRLDAAEPWKDPGAEAIAGPVV